MSGNQQHQPKESNGPSDTAREQWEFERRIYTTANEVQRIYTEADELPRICAALDAHKKKQLEAQEEQQKQLKAQVQQKKQHSLWSMFHKR
jgi:hypothetical protein